MKYTVLSLYRDLHKLGCNASMSEVKDAIDVLKNIDTATADRELVKSVLYSTLGKTATCRAAIDYIIEREKIRRELRRPEEIHLGSKEEITRHTSVRGGKKPGATHKPRKAGEHPAPGACSIEQIEKAFLVKCNIKGRERGVFASADRSTAEKVRSAVEDILKTMQRMYHGTERDIETLHAHISTYAGIASKLPREEIREINDMIKRVARLADLEENRIRRKELFDEAISKLLKGLKRETTKERTTLSKKEIDEIISRVEAQARSYFMQKIAEKKEAMERDEALVREYVKLLSRMKLRRRPVPTRKHARKIHLRRTIKKALRMGIPAEIVYKKKKPKKVDFYLIADVSGSMAEYLPEILALTNAAERVLGKHGKVFFFVDRIYPSPRDAPLGGYTDFAGLRDLDKVVTDKTVPVIVFSDLRVGGGESASEIIEELKRKGYKIYAIDPEDYDEAGTGDSEYYQVEDVLHGKAFLAPTREDLAHALAKILQEEGG